MKKLSILFACLVAVLSLNSCKEDTDPQYNEPTKFVLNTPALAAQYYELTEDGTLDLSWSQPDYGYAAAATYKVSVSLLEDFSESMELSTEYKLCYAQVSGKEIAEAVCKLRGITKEDDYTDEPARVVYFRVRGYIKGIESSNIVSNVIKLEQVKEYCAIQSPGYIYLVGSPTGWTGPDAGNAASYANWRLFEADDAIGSKIYSATFNMPAGDLYFRFYVELSGWGNDGELPSMGPYANDGTNETVTFNNGAFGGSIVPGKGSFAVMGWDGSPMKITVKLNANTVLLEKVQ